MNGKKGAKHHVVIHILYNFAYINISKIYKVRNSYPFRMFEAEFNTLVDNHSKSHVNQVNFSLTFNIFLTLKLRRVVETGETNISYFYIEFRVRIG